jgi:hypothetical protein
MRCCEACFDDEFLKTFIRNHRRRANCQFCPGREKHVIEASELKPLFARFMDLCTPLNLSRPDNSTASDSGGQLATIIQDQWGIFSNRLIRREKHHELLTEILQLGTAGIFAGKPHDRSHRTLLERWREFGDRVNVAEDQDPITATQRYRGNGDPVSVTGLEWLEEDLGRASATLAAGSLVFLASLADRDDPSNYPVEMARKPETFDLSEHEYFVGAEDISTAVAESQARGGAPLTLASFEILHDLRIIDLTEGMRRKSPFSCARENLPILLEWCELLDHLNSEFANDRGFSDESPEHRSLHRFAEWIRKEGCHGLRYGGVFPGRGHTLVIFDPGVVAFRSTRTLLAKEL